MAVSGPGLPTLKGSGSFSSLTVTIDQQSCSSRGECEGVRRVTLRAPILLFSKFGITSISFRQC